MKQAMLNIVRKINGHNATEFALKEMRRNVLYPNTIQLQQTQLSLHYKSLMEAGKKLPGFRNIGYRVYSGNNEDGILHYIFSLLGTVNKYCLDIAYANAKGSNTANLILNDSWTGLLLCGDEKETKAAISFFKNHTDSKDFPPDVQHHWIDADNVNEILEKSNVPKEIDFFSLDIDGMDYWIWKNLTIVKPRVVVVEAAAFLSRDKALTVPYDPKFYRFDTHRDYFGASLPAFIKLARVKGYRLVACNHFGYNLFFVREDLGVEILPEIDIDECFRFESPKLRQKRKERWESVKDYEWLEV